MTKNLRTCCLINLLSCGVAGLLSAVDPLPIEPVKTSAAGFLGVAERGPTTPELVTSWLHFQQKYGSYIPDSYLSYAVEGFFINGGKRCYVGRITASNAAQAALNLTSNGNAALTLHAIGEGSWGNRIVVKVGAGSDTKEANQLLRLAVFYWKDSLPSLLFDPDVDKTTLPRPTVTEVFDNVSVDSSSPDFYELRVNKISNLVKISKLTGDSGGLPNGPAIVTKLAGTGLDGTLAIGVADYKGEGKLDKRKGLSAFKEIDEITIVNVPNANPDLVKAVIAHCEERKDCFVLVDVEKSTDVTGLIPQDKYADSGYAALYYPWIRILHPVTGMETLVPPGGYVAGIFARNDKVHGVHKAPANQVVGGANDLEFQTTKEAQAILNPRGVNVIRRFPGRGILVWGARTLSRDPLWKYINVRRLFMYLEESIEEGTQWVASEPNNEELWKRVRANISEFITRTWREGALVGTKTEDAFFVKCDRTSMTLEDIDNGRLICIIGIAPLKPAEFVIFRIGQWTCASPC